MHTLAFFCKSYRPDMLRARRMAGSIHRFNEDAIPLYMCVPESDLDAFRECFEGIPCTFLTDEAVIAVSESQNGPIPALFPPHLMQQLIKLEFWRMGHCKHYAWIDSDSYFIKPFDHSAFMPDETTCYTIEDRWVPEDELARMAAMGVAKPIREKRVRQITELITRFRGFFGNRGDLMAFGGSTPIIWSCDVLEAFATDFLSTQKKSIFEMLYAYPCETQLYGEYIHSQSVFPIAPKSHMFRSFYYLEDFQASQEIGESEHSLSKDYWGICIQSNWAQLKRSKDPKERLLRHTKEFLRALGLIRFHPKGAARAKD